MTIWRCLRACASKYTPAEHSFGLFKANRMKTLGLILCLLCAATACAEDVLRFDAPKDAKRVDLDRCAVAMQKRCEAFGYKGVIAAVAVDVEGRATIDLAAKDGFTDAMRENIGKLAALPAATVTLHREHRLTQAEADQFPASGGKSPKGTLWVPGDGGTGFRCIEEKPVVEAADLARFEDFLDRGMKSGEGFILTKKKTKVLQATKDDCFDLVMVVDGVAISRDANANLFEHNGSDPTPMEEGRLKFDRGDGILPICVLIRMPFALKMRG